MRCRLHTIRVLISLMCVSAICVMSLYSLASQGSSLCACHKCLTEGDPRIRGLISASPRPFLSRKYRTPEDVFSWFKRMQNDKHNFTSYKTAVDKVFQMFPPNPDVVESSPDRCLTCAVVGNSGNLKGSRYGPLIDFHDIVIRMNYGRTKGYEADVGSRTTHHVMYPESGSYLDNTTHLVFFPYKTSDFEWLIKSFTPRENDAVKSKKRGNKDLVMILNPAFMKYVHEMWLEKKGYYPSTGFMTFVLSLLICDEVNVFGFGADRDGNWNHYFEILKNKQLKTGAHPGTYEYEMIQKLHEKQMIHFFKGW